MREQRRAPQPAGGDASAAPPTVVVLAHELAERLTALSSYLLALHRLAAVERCGDGVIDKALDQAMRAGEAVHRLRALLDGKAAGGDAPGPTEPPTRGRRRPVYRVSFFNELVSNGQVFRPCQRSIVVRAHSRKAAIETAKKRFARLEGVPDWHVHASMIEVARVDNPAEAAGRQRRRAAPPPDKG